MHENRLKKSASLYLRQHGENPVDWYPWGDEALERARVENRPIFLSIGYASCHWCHVMEEEVFEDEDVAGLLNRNFVSIKVDREERPDIDSAYMDAVVALTGNGGWPLTAFLTPDRVPFFGGTYFPKEQFLGLLRRVEAAWREDPEALKTQGRRLVEALGAAAVPGPGATPDSDLPLRTARELARRVDPAWGGARGRMKFPTPVRWSFLLHTWRKTGDEDLLGPLELTLRRMADGGLQDQVGGGFHRYTVEPSWVVPHFEKMLYDNAQLALLYTEASVALAGSPQVDFYRRTAIRTLDFLLREMRGTEGGFYASFDADSGGEEGSFYVWTPAEVTELLGREEGPVVAAALGIIAGGNFEGRSIPTDRAEGLSHADRMIVERALPILYEARSRRVAPSLDRKIITGWNGLAIQALAAGYRAFGDERYLAAAGAAATCILSTHRTTGGGLARASNDGVPVEGAILDDRAFLAVGLLELHQAGGSMAWLRAALDVLDGVIEKHGRDGGGFYLAAERGETPLGRGMEVHDSVRPSGQSAAVLALLRAGSITGRKRYTEAATDALAAWAEMLERAGPDMAHWLDGLQLLTGPQYSVVIAGEPEARRPLEERFRSLRPWHASLLSVPAAGDDSGWPQLQGKRARDGEATAFVCLDRACKRPTSDPDELEHQLLTGWHR